MEPAEIRKLLRAEPFDPLRLHLSDGSHYDVAHPELALVTQSKVAIALPAKRDQVPEEMIHCDPFHITRIVPIKATKKSSAKKNGRKRS